MPSASADPLGLLADDIEDPEVAWYRRDGGEHLVQGLGHDRRCRVPPDSPGNCFVDQAGPQTSREICRDLWTSAMSGVKVDARISPGGTRAHGIDLSH